MAKRSLKTYQTKRDFTQTPEPSGKIASSHKDLFVIQKHEASHLHYDFRLAIGGVLVSWAVPKGPSLDPRDKRLAVQTEDHPLAYGSFEGVIPEGNYGGGIVMVWDTGAYKNIKEHDGKPVSMEQCLRDGHISVWLEGSKLQGGYELVRMKDGKNWLMIKMKDECADARRKPTSTQNKSALSGKTMLQIKRAGNLYS